MFQGRRNCFQSRLARFDSSGVCFIAPPKTFSQADFHHFSQFHAVVKNSPSVKLPPRPILAIFRQKPPPRNRHFGHFGHFRPFWPFGALSAILAIS